MKILFFFIALIISVSLFSQSSDCGFYVKMVYDDETKEWSKEFNNFIPVGKTSQAFIIGLWVSKKVNSPDLPFGIFSPKKEPQC